VAQPGSWMPSAPRRLVVAGATRLRAQNYWACAGTVLSGNGPPYRNIPIGSDRIGSFVSTAAGRFVRERYQRIFQRVRAQRGDLPSVQRALRSNADAAAALAPVTLNAVYLRIACRHVARHRIPQSLRRAPACSCRDEGPRLYPAHVGPAMRYHRGSLIGAAAVWKHFPASLRET